MGTQLFNNNTTAYLNSAISAGDLSLTVQSGQGALFPSPTGGNWFLATIYGGGTNIEIVKCTARTGDVLTIVRGQESTAALAFTTGATVEMAVTAGTLTRFLQPTTGSNQVPLSDGAGTSISWTDLKTVNGNSIIGSGDIVITSPGSSGTTITGNVTLTSSSPSAMVVTPTGPGLYATAPNATTLSKAIAEFSIYNSGEYDYGFNDSTGTHIGWVLPKSGAVFSLADNSTAAGVWGAAGASKLGITAKYDNPALSNMTNSIIRWITIDADRDFILMVGTDIYGMVVSKANGQGTPTLIKATVISGCAVACLVSSTQVLVTYNTSGTSWEALTLTLPASGNTITSVNTGTKATFSSTAATTSALIGPQMVAVGSTYCLGYSMGSTNGAGVRGITISGTTPTVGSELVIGSGTAAVMPPLLFASGSVLRTLTMVNPSLTATPYSVSGSTLTLGTAATSNASGTLGTFAFLKSWQNGNGNISGVEAGSSALGGFVVKLTGTTEAITRSSAAATTAASADKIDVVRQLSSSKSVLAWTNGSTASVNILTDTAGTASMGTAYTDTGAPTNIGIVAVSGNNVRVATGGTTYAAQYTLDCSGASPSLSSLQVVNGTNLALPQGGLDPYGNRDMSMLYSVGNAVTLAFSTVWGTQYQAAGINSIKTPPFPKTTATGVAGATASESYLGGTPTGHSGVSVYKIEVAA